MTSETDRESEVYGEAETVEEYVKRGSENVSLLEVDEALCSQ